MENKKIKNATPKEYNGIKFRSLMEVSAYKHLLSQGFNPEYEKHKYVIWEGYKPTIPYYGEEQKTKGLKLYTSKLISTTYTPDFTFKYKSIFVILEIKGFRNDLYPLKMKLFRKYLESNIPNAIFFEVRTIKQLKQSLKIMDEYEKSYSQNKRTSEISS